MPTTATPPLHLIPKGFRLITRDEFWTMYDVGTQLVYDAVDDMLMRMKVLGYDEKRGWVLTTLSSVPTGCKIRLDYGRYLPVALVEEGDIATLLQHSISQATAAGILDDEAERRRTLIHVVR